MDARQLEYFLAIVDHDGFVQAAQHLHVAQPSLSQAIARLERELGVELFHRIGRGVVLSTAGEELIRAVVNFIGNAVATLFVGTWDNAVDADRVRRVLDDEPVPELPIELDAAGDPLAVESTVLVGAYTHDVHHHEHPAPAEPYTVDGATAKLGASVGSPVVGDATDRSPVLGDRSRS